ncbi:23S rRNA (uracil(1939)-C(5))-methyltransferase RlmD [bacterium]|nr:23S rRNA (uracil(1939)-C(5))-methyltransferase RlmD [bacterium]
MKIGEEFEVTIEKISNLGLGICRVNGFVIFVENSCPNDRLKIKISKLNKNFGHGFITEILEPSVHRTVPFCPMQKVCGACQFQHIDYNYQLEIKRQIVKETIHNIGGIDIEIPSPIPSPQIKNYRRKIQYPVSETKNSKRILAGYYKQSSHELLNIKYCPIQPKICDEIIEFIRENAPKFNIHGYIEQKHSGDLRHIVIRSSSINNKNLVCLVVNNNKISQNLENFAKAIYENFEEVSGVCINLNNKKSNIILGNKTVFIVGNKHIEEYINGKKFLISAETFFQVNPRSAENIFKYVKDYIKNNFKEPLVLDAYAGISAFGICISDVAEKVVTIEENNNSVELAKKSVELNKIDNIEIHCGDAGEYFSNEKRLFDVVIIDPPRKGCSIRSLNEAYRLCKDTIIYVSCNPATLARDLKYLKQKGCIIESIQPFDMFCHTYHIENTAIIKVNK